MDAPDGAQRLLTAIYDAAVDDDAWARLPDVICETIGGDSASLWFGSEFGPSTYTYNHEPAKYQMYADHYRLVDPWMAAVRKRSLFSGVYRGSDLISDRELRKTEFFSDFMLPTRTGPVLGCTLRIGAKVCALAVYRLTGEKEFSDDQRHRLQKLLPHIEQAVRLRSKVEEQKLSSRLVIDVLQSLSEAIVVCSREGIVLYMNDAAEELETKVGHFSLGSAHAAISLGYLEQTRKLRTLIGDAADGGSGGGLCVDTPDCARLFITISPLPGRLYHGTFGRALVAIRCEGQYNLPSGAYLREVFDLTMAEAEISLGLLKNQSLSQIQADRGVSENTIRTQLAHVLAKTGTSNQRELVRLLSALPLP